MHGVEEKLIVERLLQEFDSTALHCPDRDRYVTMSGDEDDWDECACRLQAVLQLEPTHPRHANVEDDAASGSRRVIQQKLIGRREDLDFQLYLLHQPTNGVAHGRIVIHNEDSWRAALLRGGFYSALPVGTGIPQAAPLFGS